MSNSDRHVRTGRSPDDVYSENKVALIIGNSAYGEAPLRNPVNDAADMARVLQNLDFEVQLLLDATYRKMKESVAEFGRKLLRSGVGLFYFAGHGLQIRGHNYIIPIGADIQKEQDVEFESVDVGRILGEMEYARNCLNVFILDACRNNPFARSFRSPTRGLAQMIAPNETLIAYATSPGDVAEDGGGGKNSPYTEALLQVFPIPGLDILDIFRRTAAVVKEKTTGRQRPWIASDVTQHFYFLPPELGETIPSPAKTLPESESLVAEEERKRKAQEEKKRKAEEEQKRIAEEEERRKAEKERIRKAEEDRIRKAEEERKRKAEEEKQHTTEEERKPKYHLRSAPKTDLSTGAVKNMLKEKGFYGTTNVLGFFKKGKGIDHQYKTKTVKGDKIVIDHATGLMWQQSGSPNYMSYEDAKKYIDQLNRDSFAGYSDWRLPTLEEAMSLMEPEKSSNALYIKPVFDKKQEWIWTSDKASASAAWSVYFGSGYCNSRHVGLYDGDVRAVRFGQSSR
jgi:hypothetical protein